MPEPGQGAITENRIAFLDNLRTFMIFLVVVIHAGIVYDAIGKALAPLGLELDYERIKETRPQIAEMLR